jgi:hypothetical protein
MKAAPMDEAGDREMAGEPSGMHNKRRAARFRRTATLPPQPYGSPGEYRYFESWSVVRLAILYIVVRVCFGYGIHG